MCKLDVTSDSEWKDTNAELMKKRENVINVAEYSDTNDASNNTPGDHTEEDKSEVP